MTGTYKDFYKFVSIKNPYLIDLWIDINNRPNPHEGDLFRIPDPNINNVEHSIMHFKPTLVGKFVKVDFDSKFENGVAFYYIFNCNGKEIKIRSINDVYDVTKLTFEDHLDLFGFWTRCEPINNDEV